MFTWLKKRRRQKLLAVPFPESWIPYLERVKYYPLLGTGEQARLQDALRIFIEEKDWEGCRGLVITEEIQVTVAALAALMVLGLDDFYFDQVQTILVYPRGFVAREKSGLGGDAFLEGVSERLGEAHYRGPVILSWDEILLDIHEPGQGRNLVIHEFAHQLDMLNGEADGVPKLPATLEKRWQRVMAREFARLQRRAEQGWDTLLDPYGATEPAEFFAVASECFFDLPQYLRQEHSQLYELLRDYYRQDPARWES